MEILYWISRIDAINNFLMAATIIINTILIGGIYIGIEYYDNGFYYKITKWCLVLGIIALILTILTPTKEDLIMMYNINSSLEDSVQFKNWLEK